MTPEFSILIVDRKDGRRNGLSRAIRSAQPNVKVYAHNTGSGDWKPEIPLDATPALVLFHWSDEAQLIKTTIKEAVARSAVLLAYSGAGVPSSEELPKGWFSIPRPLDHADHLSRREWEELLVWAENPDRSSEHLPRALHADFPRVATALLILCQGFEAMATGKLLDPGRARAAMCDKMWWRTPFAPVKDLAAELKRELGTPNLPQPLERLISWISQAKDQPLRAGRAEDSKTPTRGPNAEEDQAGLNEMVMAAESVLSRELGAPMVVG
jgi:hypothetical protein